MIGEEKIIKKAHKLRLKRFTATTTIGEDRHLSNFINEELPQIIRMTMAQTAKNIFDTLSIIGAKPQKHV